MKFRRDINGLRAIAVLAVVLFHFKPGWLSGGFTGVDVFFVISGYLMTSIIYQGLQTQRFSLLSFYMARARRIIPALVVLCSILLFFGWYYLTPSDYRALGKHAASSLGFFSNFIYYGEAGYFDAASHDKWLLHTWSLSVEWQFYIVYPLILLVITNLTSLKMVSRIILGTAFAALGFSIYSSFYWPDSAFYLLPARSWEMMIGGIAFLLPLSLSSKQKKIAFYLGVTIIFASYIFLSDDEMWPGYLALFPVLGAYCVINAEQNNNAFIDNRVVQMVGSWSYSIYLWHWPVVVFFNNLGKPDNSKYVLSGIGLSFLLGWLSYRYVESQTQHYTKTTVNRMVIATTLVIGTLASLTNLTSGFRAFKPDNGLRELTKNQIMPTRDNGYCFYNFNKNKNLEVGDKGLFCRLGNDNSPVTGLLFGDSYEPFWDYILNKQGIAINTVSTNWCFPSFSHSFTGPKSHISYEQCQVNRKFLVENISTYEFIILSGQWDNVYKKGYLDEIFEVADEAIARGLTVYIMASPTTYDTNVLKRFHAAVYNNLEFNLNRFPKTKDGVAQKTNDALKIYANKNQKAIFIGRSELFNTSDLYLKSGVEMPYSLDGKHISLEGSIFAAQHFENTELHKAIVAQMQQTGSTTKPKRPIDPDLSS